MKITIFTYGFKPEKFLINKLVEEFSNRHEIEVSTGLPNYPIGKLYDNYSYLGPYFEKQGSNTILKRYPVIPRKKGFLFLTLNYFTNLLFGLLNIFRLQKSDCIFVFATSPIMTAIPAIIFGKLYRIPVVVWLQDLWPESFNAITGIKEDSLISKVLGLMVKWIYNRTDSILIQSPAFTSNLDKYGYKKQVEWIPNWGMSIKDNSSADWIPESGEDDFIITFAGNIGAAQDLNTLLKAASLLKDQKNIKFYIVGDGREKARLEKGYSHLSNVIFFGSKPAGDMMPLFKSSSVLLVILRKDPVFSQVIPSKMQTYMKARKPIISVLDGAGAQLAKENNLGPVVNPGDYKKLAQEIEFLSSASSEELNSYSNNAHALYEEYFKEDVILNKIENLLKKTAK